MNPATCALEDLKTQGRAVIAFRRCIINRPENHEVRALRFRLRNAFDGMRGYSDESLGTHDPARRARRQTRFTQMNPVRLDDRREIGSIIDQEFGCRRLDQGVNGSS